ncbi:unnamed protein product, partial [Polarella glacialis]
AKEYAQLEIAGGPAGPCGAQLLVRQALFEELRGGIGGAQTSAPRRGPGREEVAASPRPSLWQYLENEDTAWRALRQAPATMDTKSSRESDSEPETDSEAEEDVQAPGLQAVHITSPWSVAVEAQDLDATDDRVQLMQEERLEALRADVFGALRGYQREPGHRQTATGDGMAAPNKLVDARLDDMRSEALDQLGGLMLQQDHC